MEAFEVSDTFDASAEEIYTGWLDAEVHAEFSGGEAADIDARVGGAFKTGNGYATGKILEMEDKKKIVQAWRTTEFPAGSPDSKLEIVLEEKTPGKTTVIIKQSDVPDGQGDNYKKGWADHYFKPMKDFFKKRSL
jgi:activator of HSP90 ATPase